MQIMHALAASTLIISVSHAQLGRDNRHLHPGHELYDALGLHDIPMQLQASGVSDASLSADEQKARLHGIFAPPATAAPLAEPSASAVSLIHAMEMEAPAATPHPRDSVVGGNCFSLRTSRYCGGNFGDYFMSSRSKVNGQHVLDTRGFDSVLDGYFNTSSEFEYINSFFDCESWSGYPTPRYRIAYTCRSLLESAEAKLCNKLHQPPPLCKDSCSVYVNQWAEVTSNAMLCKNTGLAEFHRLSLAQSCDSAPYNGSIGCIPGIESGAEICGKLV
ncbi:hypothetical protein EC988_001541 [Linderina pennispora]|nr:hypothetical protein EC988_001541 [Linderina pennispora]